MIASDPILKNFIITRLEVHQDACENYIFTYTMERKENHKLEITVSGFRDIVCSQMHIIDNNLIK